MKARLNVYETPNLHPRMNIAIMYLLVVGTKIIQSIPTIAKIYDAKNVTFNPSILYTNPDNA